MFAGQFAINSDLPPPLLRYPLYGELCCDGLPPANPNVAEGSAGENRILRLARGRPAVERYVGRHELAPKLLSKSFQKANVIISIVS
jgi:hypothetical protein